MIKSCKAVILLEGKILDCQDHIEFSLEWSEERGQFSFEFKADTCLSEFFLDIEFTERIASWRYLDYTWKTPGAKKLVANSHSPKILKLEAGRTVVANNPSGCWEYQPDTGGLRWYFYHPMLSPTMVYDQNDQRHFLSSQVIKKGTILQNGLISSHGKVEEWARTPMGFQPIVCFTDHSDFDTQSNLQIQRSLFSSLGIKVTKGFFLYDYTHKSENASFESADSRKELLRWDHDGHELAYHALSQSYRGDQSEMEFQEFKSPEGVRQVTCYIDHGFHPYNYTKQKLGDWTLWYAHMYGKGVRLIWSYIDSGEGNLFTVNQLNPEGFTLNAMLKSSRFFKAKGLKRSRKTDFRNFLMYGMPENVLRTSKFLKGSLEAFRSKPGLKSMGSLAENLTELTTNLINPETIRSIKRKGKEIFDVNRFGTVFFKACNQQTTDIRVFQTLSVRDFDVVFSEEALENLQRESGLMIAHTYFSYTGENHEGRIFKNDSGEIRSEAKSALERLAKKIQAGQIWNPTITELSQYFLKFDSISYHKEGEDLKISGFDGIVREIA